MIEQSVDYFGGKLRLGCERLGFEFPDRNAVTLSQFTDTTLPVLAFLKPDAGQRKIWLTFKVISISAIDHVATVAAFINVDRGHFLDIFIGAVPFGVKRILSVPGQEYMAGRAVVLRIEPRYASLAHAGFHH